MSNSEGIYQSVSGSQILGGMQAAQASGDVQQIQQAGEGQSAGHSVSNQTAMQLLEQLDNLVKQANLPTSKKEKAVGYLFTAKSEAEEEKPDKDLIAKSLQRVVEIVKKSDEAAEATKGLWDKVKPIFEKLSVWLGVVVGSLLG